MTSGTVVFMSAGNTLQAKFDRTYVVELQKLASSTFRAPSWVSKVRKRISRVFVVWQRYGRRDHRDTRRHRDSQLHRPTGQGDRRRGHGATAYRGHISATVLRRAERVRRDRDGTQGLWFQAGRARGNGNGRGYQFLLHGGRRRRWRHVQDHPGHRKATGGQMLGTPAPVTQRLFASAHALPPLSGASADGWHSLATFANIPSGSTANLEGEPSALVYR